MIIYDNEHFIRITRQGPESVYHYMSQIMTQFSSSSIAKIMKKISQE